MKPIEVDASEDKQDAASSEEALKAAARRRRDEELAQKRENERHLRKACTEGNIEFVQRLLDAKVSPSGANSSGSTPLHEAAFKGCTQVCDLLIAYSARVSEEDKWGATALHHAAGQGRLDIVKLLIACEADVNAMTQTNDMPLDLAKKNGHHHIEDILVTEAVNRYEQRRRESRSWCAKCTSLSVACGVTLVSILYAAGYVTQDSFWLLDAHATAL